MEKIRLKERVAYSFGDFAANFVWQTLSVYCLFYFTNVVGIKTSDAVGMIAISKVLDGISDVVMGILVDRTDTKYGKVRPWIIGSALPLAVSMVLLFSVPLAFGYGMKLAWMWVTYNLVTTIFYTANNIPYTSLVYFMTDRSEERNSLNITRLVFAFVAQAIVNALTLVLVKAFSNGSTTDPKGWTWMAVLFGVLITGLNLFTFYGTRERVKTAKAGSKEGPSLRESLHSILHNKYLLMLLSTGLINHLMGGIVGGSAVFYAQYVLNHVEYASLVTNAQTIPQALGLLLLIPVLSKKLGKHKTFMTGMIIGIIGVLSGFFLPPDLVPAMACNALRGIGIGGGGAMVYGMFMDSIDYGEWKSGINSAGVATSLLMCCGKIGTGVGTYILGLLLTAGGFDSSLAEQSAAGILSIRIAYFLVPAIVVFIILIIMSFYRLDKEYPEIIQKLKERKLNTAR